MAACGRSSSRRATSRPRRTPPTSPSSERRRTPDPAAGWDPGGGGGGGGVGNFELGCTHAVRCIRGQKAAEGARAGTSWCRVRALVLLMRGGCAPCAGGEHTAVLRCTRRVDDACRPRVSDCRRFVARGLPGWCERGRDA
eukprot:6499812-Prymnesium_polylepis.1